MENTVFLFEVLKTELEKNQALLDSVQAKMNKEISHQERGLAKKIKRIMKKFDK